MRNQPSAIRVIGLALFLCCIQQSGGAEPPLIYDLGFETGTLEGWNVQSVNVPEVTTERVRSGKYALKSFLDSGAPTSEERERTELKVLESGDAAVIGNEYWYGFSIFLPTSWVPDTIQEILGQLQSGKDPGDIEGRNPTFIIATDGENWRIVNRSDPRPITTDKEGRAERTLYVGPYVTDEWTDWVINVRWSYESDGFLKIWKNGVLIVDATGPNCYNDAKGPHFKMGIYKGYWANKPPSAKVKTRTAYHDAFRMAGADGSYDDVAPGPLAARPAAPTEVDVQ
jgi:hypothetical protein